MSILVTKSFHYDCPGGSILHHLPSTGNTTLIPISRKHIHEFKGKAGMWLCGPRFSTAGYGLGKPEPHQKNPYAPATIKKQTNKDLHMMKESRHYSLNTENNVQGAGETVTVSKHVLALHMADPSSIPGGSPTSAVLPER